MPKAVALIRCSALSVAAEHAAPAPADALPIFLAGSCPLKSDGPCCGAVDFATWAVKCIEKMNVALAETGAGHEDVIPARVLVASAEQADLVAAWEVIRDASGAHDVPIGAHRI